MIQTTINQSPLINLTKFGNFDTTHLPLIQVTLGPIRDRDDFKNFLSEWENCNRAPNYPPYYFMFYTSQVSGASISYCVMMSTFIKKLKLLQRQGKQGLQASIIIVNRDYIRFFLKIIFNLQRPVADVYLVPNQEMAFTVYRILYSQQSVASHLPITKISKDSSLN